MQRKFAILIALIILLIPVSGARAGSTDDVFCGDLPEADCQILLDNATVMDSLNSAFFFFSMNVLTGADEDLQFFAQGYGEFELNDEALQAISDLSEFDSEADWGALVEMLLTSAEADVSLDLRDHSGAEEVKTEMKLKLKDGILLIGPDTLAALTGESAAGMEAFGVDLNDAIGELLGESGALSMSGVSDFEEAEADAMSISRLPDSEVRDVAVAVFQTDIDLNTFFSLVSAEQLVAASNDLQDPQAVEAMVESINVRDFYVKQYIGLEDHYTHEMDMLLNMTMAAEKDGQSLDSPFGMNMLISLSRFDEPVDVTIPEDAFVFPLAMLMQMGEQ